MAKKKQVNVETSIFDFDSNDTIHQPQDALEITRQNMKIYGLSCAKGRAYPCLLDGLKTSYRRAIYGMHLHNSHKTLKVAELSAFALPYHPHPSSVAETVISLGDEGNVLKLMETQGQWGNSTLKHGHAAERYIGGYLSNLAEDLLCEAVEYTTFVKGEIEKDEPEALPALLPICFINGLTGIPSGLPTLNIPTLNIDEMIDYYISILSHKSLDYTPKKLPSPNLNLNVLSDKSDWENILKTGKGSIRVAPIMNIDKKGVIHIYSIPGSKDVQTIQTILEKEFLAEKIDIRDESTTSICIVIEKVPKKQCDMEEIYNRLYNKLQMTLSFNMAFYDKEKIYVPCSFNKVVKANLAYLIDTHQRKIEHHLQELNRKKLVFDTIDKFKASTLIRKITELSEEELLEKIQTQFKVDKEIAKEVAGKPITYLTKNHQVELDNLLAEINEATTDSKDIYEYLIKKYKNIRKEIQKAQEKRKGE